MLKFNNVSFSYDQAPVLSKLSFSLARGEILALMGPSGQGKSTLLNLVAGLSKPTEGEILSNAERIAYAFQDTRLFPWLTVEENIRAVLPKGDHAAAIDEVLSTVELTDCNHLYPNELSGGMRTRAALARALAYGGDLLLLDEPFAALDEDLRARLAPRLRAWCRNRGISVILVTHQTDDAALIADRILMI